MFKFESFYKILGILFIIAGIIFWISPIPGTSLLIILGLVWLIGKDRSNSFLKKLLGNKKFKFLKIDQIINKL